MTYTPLKKIQDLEAQSARRQEALWEREREIVRLKKEIERLKAKWIHDHPMPWKELFHAGWRIVGMNHYHQDGAWRLFVAMTHPDTSMCIQAEGVDEHEVWTELQNKANQL